MWRIEGHRILLRDRCIQMNGHRNTPERNYVRTVVILYTDRGRWAWERWDEEREEKARGKSTTLDGETQERGKEL